MASQSLTWAENSSVVIPVCVAAMMASAPFSPPAATPAISPLSSEANGSRVFQSGYCGARAFTQSKANTTWNGRGFSDHSVPSLSKVAIRSGGGTESGPPSRVTRFTKSTIDRLLTPSFHEARGSDGAAAPDAFACAAVGCALPLHAAVQSTNTSAVTVTRTNRRLRSMRDDSFGLENTTLSRRAGAIAAGSVRVWCQRLVLQLRIRNQQAIWLIAPLGVGVCRPAGASGVPMFEVQPQTSERRSTTYDFGISFSTIWSTVKLAAFCLGGNALKLSSHS